MNTILSLSNIIRPLLGRRNATLRLAGLLLVGSAGAAWAQGTAFTYQGRLGDQGHAANGSYDLRCAIYDGGANGSLVAGPLTNSATGVTNGLFTVTLDFGSGVFTGPPRWLDVAIRTNGSASDFTLLSPRRLLTPAPYTVMANSASNLLGTLPDARLSPNVARLDAQQTFAGAVSFSPAAGPPFSVSSSAQVVNLNADLLDGLDSTALWLVGGNAGTAPGVNFLGTTDNQPLEVKVNAERALRLEPNGTSTPSVIGGFRSNLVAAGVSGAVIAGGGGTNQVNTLQASFSTIGGGGGNTVQAAGGYAAYAVIGGGYNNNIQTSANYGTIAGGTGNLIQNSTANGAIGGGAGNNIQMGAHQGTIGGGSVNVISASAHDAVVSGGAFNKASSAYATVPGGQQNEAIGAYSFAAGHRAKANQGSFVWADSTDVDFIHSGSDQFAVRAHGGVWFQTGLPGVTMDGPLQINGLLSGATLDATSLTTGTIPDARLSGNVALRTGGNTFTGNQVVSSGNLTLGSGSIGIGTTTPQAKLDVAGDAQVSGTSFTTTGDTARLVLGDGNHVLRSIYGVGCRLGVWPNADALAIADGTGNVGIGTTSPQAKLEVAGRVRALAVEGADSQPMEFYVNGGSNPADYQRALRLQYGASALVVGPNVIAGWLNNVVGAGVAGATIAGGGCREAYLGGRDLRNQVLSDCSTIGGGDGNSIGTNSFGSVVSGGDQNMVHPSSGSGTIGGGVGNEIAGNPRTSWLGPSSPGLNTVAGGGANVILSNSAAASIGGGVNNTIQTNCSNATIPGGSYAQAVNYGQLVYASGNFGTWYEGGNAQTSLYVLRNQTLNANTTELFLDGGESERRISMPTGSTWTFEILVVARSQNAGEFGTSQRAGFRIWGVINHDGSGTHLDFGDGQVLYPPGSPWAAYAMADNVNNALVVKVVGDSRIALRWVATVRTAEVMWPE
jgi:hypothetical protein